MSTFVIPKFIFPEPNENQIALLKKRFDSLDTNHNGKLEKNEITAALKAEKMPVDRVDLIFAIADKNHNNAIEFEEFEDALKIVGKAIVDKKNLAVQLFLRLDLDHNGLLDENEIFNFMKYISGGKATREQAKRAIAEQDKDKDGMISLDEFLKGAKFE